MKTIKTTALAFLATLACLISPLALSAQSDWDFQEFAKVTKNKEVLFTLEWGTLKDGYNGYVKWRLTNHTAQTIYDIAFEDKVYTLSDGRTTKEWGQRVAGSLAPGASVVKMDNVNASENTGGLTRRNSNPVKKVEIKEPMLKFAVEKGGERHGWELAGTLEMAGKK